MEANTKITLRGVRVHNLKSIDVDIPLLRLTVVTGVSGAGKSSLVFDTLYAEAQRRYLQSFSTYTRQFLERFDKPDADEIGDLPPAIAIRAAPSASSPRATVGSLTEISDDLRLLFARVGEVVCPRCNQLVRSHRPRDVLAALQALPVGTRRTIAFPASIEDGIDQAAWLAGLLEEGYVRVQIGGGVYRLDEPGIPLIASTDAVWVLLDRVDIGTTAPERLSESIELAYRRGNGRLGVLGDSTPQIYDQRFTCSGCERVFPTPEPRLFDCNDPLGACPACQGVGTVGKTADPCPTCAGRRWNADALAVRLHGLTIAEWSERPLAELVHRVETLALPEASGPSVRMPAAQIERRLQALVALDLGYLPLLQSAAHLSDGESLRIALTTALASNLVQVLYLVDEPTTGLHAGAVGKLVEALKQLRDRGNTVVVIEHERRIIAAADHVIDLGPEAGADGGTVTFQGPPADLANAPANPTSDFWCGRSRIEVPVNRRQPNGSLKLVGACTNNLKHLTVEFPLGVLCVVTGVGGAGKRSLIEQTLYPALAKSPRAHSGAKVSMIGAHRLADTVLLDQSALPRSARSNPATHLKIFDEIRSLFAEAVDARIRNFGPGHFSFNQPGGRCETCEGQGSMTIDMQFLADVVSLCPDCQGRRFRKEILDIKVRSLSIAEVLDLTIREAFRFFRAQAKIEKKLRWLLDVGLDYLRLGQPLETLSGGECQRLKLAGHLASSRTAGLLFLLTEPSAGLHPADVANLLECFDRLLAAGHSVIAIDQDPDLIRCADHVIELGPADGKDGGTIIAQGPPPTAES